MALRKLLAHRHRHPLPVRLGPPAGTRRTRRRPAGVLVGALACSLGLAGSPLARADPSLAIDAAADQHPVSPAIYGMNFADPALGRELALPTDRWGGNTTDTYNWRLGSSNTGNDWYFENTADCQDPAYKWCNGGAGPSVFAYRDFVAKDRSLGAQTVFTLPLMGYVAATAPLDHPFQCGFPKALFPTQDSFDPYDPGCGNGQQGTVKLAADPARDGIPIDASYDGALVQDLVGRYGSAARGGVGLYELGNEPALWNDTHRDMHPAPASYDELWQKTRDAAVAVKAADPGAGVLGFSEWGWPNYLCSAADEVDVNGCTARSPDRANHGGVPLAEWLLQQARAYEQAHGTRLLDYLDLHYYAQGGSTSDITRSLWDPTYTDPSWIAENIDLIPRMKAWAAADYPGTKVSLSEYNLSLQGDPVTNALIQADVLGIFGRQGLDLATRWPLDYDGNLIADAFRMYRDYDGAHGQFGDVSIRATSSDQAQLAVYAARRSSDGAYTVMVINKTASALTSPLTLGGLSAPGSIQRWSWSGGAIARAADPTIQGSQLGATYPPRSISLFVLGGAGASSDPPPPSDPGGGPSPGPPAAPSSPGAGPAAGATPSPAPGLPPPGTPPLARAPGAGAGAAAARHPSSGSHPRPCPRARPRRPARARRHATARARRRARPARTRAGRACPRQRQRPRSSRRRAKRRTRRGP